MQAQRYLGDNAVMQYIEPPFTPEQTAGFIRAHGLCVPPRVYALEEKGGGVVGHVIFHPSDRPGVYELGWVLSRAVWRRGYAEEISRRVLRHAFGPMGLREVEMQAVPENGPSLALMGKLGAVMQPGEGALLRAVIGRREWLADNP